MLNPDTRVSTKAKRVLSRKVLSDRIKATNADVNSTWFKATRGIKPCPVADFST